MKQLRFIRKYKKKCKCRKPGNKMILDLKKKWDINFKKSFMIGDKRTDELCAIKSKLKFFYAKENLFDQIKSITKKRSLCFFTRQVTFILFVSLLISISIKLTLFFSSYLEFINLYS